LVRTFGLYENCQSKWIWYSTSHLRRTSLWIEHLGFTKIVKMDSSRHLRRTSLWIEHLSSEQVGEMDFSSHLRRTSLWSEHLSSEQVGERETEFDDRSGTVGRMKGDVVHSENVIKTTNLRIN
jgi:hypothetical protein